MNPTANKSDFEDLTTNLKDLAYAYLEKYSPSKQQLKVFLLKKYLTKIKGTKSKKEVTAIIDEIILNLEKNKIINDELYSDSKARMFLRRMKIYFWLSKYFSDGVQFGKRIRLLRDVIREDRRAHVNLLTL